MRTLLLLAALGVVPRLAVASVADPRFAEVILPAPGITELTGLARPPDGTNRMFIIQKGGVIRVLEDGVLAPQTFASIAPIYTGSECGLIGITFDPDYATNRWLYLFVTVSSSEQRILRLTDNNGVGIEPTPIVTGIPTIGANHDGGGIGFGPDGNLYFSVGDNGSGRGVNMDLSLLASKVGRVRPDGAVPADNPFADGPGGNHDLIWARGFRNPFTLTFEPGRGRLWVNTVGTSYEQIFVVGAGDHAGWNTYENTQPAGYLAPVIKYRTNGSDQRAIGAGGAVRASGTLEVTTTSAHGFRRGERVTLSGLGDGTFNGVVYVSSTPSATRFTATQAGPDATSGGGTAASPQLGGCVSGGTFYDGTGFPADTRGDLFFGDYNSDRLMRAELDAGGDVEKVEIFAENLSSVIDAEVGADAALYLASHGGRLTRIEATSGAQSIVLSSTHLRLAEGGRAGFSVRLAAEPASDVTVTVRSGGGDADVTVEDGASLVFTPATWERPQPVMLFAALDLDTVDDVAQLDVEAPGLGVERLEVTVRDETRQSLALGATRLEVPEGSAATFTVALAEAPDAAVTVTVTSTSPSLLIAAGETLTFGPIDYATPKEVTVAAFEDADGTDERASVSISAPVAASRSVAIVVRDNDRSPPMFTGAPPLGAIVGATYQLDAEASGLPAPSFVLAEAPAGVVLDGVTGVLAFVPRAPGEYDFVLRATNGVAPDAELAWTITAVADQPPRVMIVKPEPGAILSGSMVPWYGTATDDVGVARAEFLVDGTVSYTVTSSAGRYDFGGAANRFDTTTLADGPHTLQLVVEDGAGQAGVAEVQVTVANQVVRPDAGATGEVPAPAGEDGGCGCTAASATRGPGTAPGLVLALVVGLLAGHSCRRSRAAKRSGRPRDRGACAGELL